jgi:hypothetical protein
MSNHHRHRRPSPENQGTSASGHPHGENLTRPQEHQPAAVPHPDAKTTGPDLADKVLTSFRLALFALLVLVVGRVLEQLPRDNVLVSLWYSFPKNKGEWAVALLAPIAGVIVPALPFLFIMDKVHVRLGDFLEAILCCACGALMGLLAAWIVVLTGVTLGVGVIAVVGLVEIVTIGVATGQAGYAPGLWVCASVLPGIVAGKVLFG